MDKHTLVIGAMTAMVTLAACGGGGSSKGSSSPTSAPGSTSATTQANTNDQSGTNTTVASTTGGPDTLKDSKMYSLTKLTDAQLCGVLQGDEPTQILGTATAAGKFSDTLGLGVICEWKATAGPTELYVGLSTVVDYAAAGNVDQILNATTTSIDGHPALAADHASGNDYALIHVALGADHDPAAEFRAPTMDAATTLAQTVTPRLIALGSN
jgi:hypothetical protein